MTCSNKQSCRRK